MELDRCSASSKNDHRVEQIADPNTEEEERKVQENRGENQQREATIPRSTTGDGGARKERGGSSRRSHQSQSSCFHGDFFVSAREEGSPTANQNGAHHRDENHHLDRMATAVAGSQ
jgi:hypothetical protein